MAESKVTGIVRSLNALEEDLDSLNSRVGDMKKQLSVKATTEIDNLLEKTREMATREAEVIINASREKATAESGRISQEGDAKLSKTQFDINANFDEAVKHVVSIILKP